MTDRPDPRYDDPTLRQPPPPPAHSATSDADDRLAAAEDRAAAAEHRARVAEAEADDDGVAARSRTSYAEVEHKPTYGLGSILALIGAAGVLVSIFLSWVQDDLQSAFGESETISATDVPIQFLWDTIPADQDPSLLFVLLPAAALILIGSLIPRARWVGWLGGIVALAVPVLYTITAGRRTGEDDFSGSGFGAFDWIDIGTWVCAIAAAVSLIGLSMLPHKEIVRRHDTTVAA